MHFRAEPFYQLPIWKIHTSKVVLFRLNKGLDSFGFVWIRLDSFGFVVKDELEFCDGVMCDFAAAVW